MTISKIRIKMLKPSREPLASSKTPNQDFKDIAVLCTFKIQNISVSKTSDHIQINIKMPNPRQEPPASSKAKNKDLKDMDVFCTFKIKIGSPNSDHGCVKDQ